MKIEIDLNDILGDEFGAETLQESVRRQVIEKMIYEIKQGIGKKIDSEIARLIDTEIKEAIKAQMPKLVDDLMNTEYTCVDRYGDRGKQTTFRQQLVKGINEELVYAKKSYDSDKNVFSKTIDNVVSENVKQFQKEFESLVNKDFVTQTLNFATDTLKKKLGL